MIRQRHFVVHKNLFLLFLFIFREIISHLVRTSQKIIRRQFVNFAPNMGNIKKDFIFVPDYSYNSHRIYKNNDRTQNFTFKHLRKRCALL